MATIALCMIARDEEKFIANAIGSVRDVVDEIVVVDTGSKDRTPEIAREFGATVLHFKWGDDFSAARNFGLEHVSSDWILVLDADEEVLKEDSYKIRQLADADCDAFLFIQKNFSNVQGFGMLSESRKGFKGYYPSFIVRMFRNKKGIRFEGFVHETVDACLKNANARLGIASVGIYHYQELKGDNEFRKKQIKYAEILEKRIDEFPDRAKAYHDIGIVHYRFMNDYEKAADCFRKSIALFGRNASVFNDLGVAYIQLGRYKDALDAFGKSVGIRPDPSAFFNIGLLQEKLGDYEAAILAYEEAVRLNYPGKERLAEKIDMLRSLVKNVNR